MVQFHLKIPLATDSEYLTPISQASLLGDISKQYSPRCDATERGVPSGAIQFAWRIFIETLINSKNHS